MVKKLEERVSLLEMVATDLAKANETTNNVIEKLAVAVSNEVKAGIKSQFEEEFVTREKEIESNVTIAVSGVIDEKIKSQLDERGLNRQDMTRLKKVRDKRFIELLGNPECDRYQLFIGFYQSAMSKGYRNKFNCAAYGDIEASRFKEALAYEKSFDINPDYYDWCVQTLHNNYKYNEFSNKPIKNAQLRRSYERFFRIAID